MRLVRPGSSATQPSGSVSTLSRAGVASTACMRPASTRMEAFRSGGAAIGTTHEAVYRILFEGLAPRTAMAQLTSRELKSEFTMH